MEMSITLGISYKKGAMLSMDLSVTLKHMY